MKEDHKVQKVNATPQAAYFLEVLALDLWEKYKEEHRALGILRPSTKVAIDFMISETFTEGKLRPKSYKINQNWYYKILGKNMMKGSGQVKGGIKG